MSEEDTVAGRTNGFTTKEMLVRLETIVDRIEAKLDAKADKSDFNAFEVKQVATEAAINLRLVALETRAVASNEVLKYKRYLVATIIALATLSGWLISLVHLH
jgi:2-methylisocitrate lyase-like PEP mutase family enzyme